MRHRVSLWRSYLQRSVLAGPEQALKPVATLLLAEPSDTFRDNDVDRKLAAAATVGFASTASPSTSRATPLSRKN
jgi:hypothetical protein